MSGKVYLVGAGPGRGDLITLAALRHLRDADAVVYDRLVSDEILSLADARSEKLYVGKMPVSAGHCTPQAQINQLLADLARQGKKVVRLKGGDPLLFARGWEEAKYLESAGISYEVVPGVTAGLAAAAFAGVPLTARGVSSAVAFITGHESPEKSAELDWRQLAHFPGTLVIYMGFARIGEMAAQLIRHGKTGDTPVTFIHSAGLASQQFAETTLAKVVGEKPDFPSPVLTIIGESARPEHRLRWYTSLPLRGKTVVSCRPAAPDDELVDRLLELGANVVAEPSYRIDPAGDALAFEPTLRKLASFDTIVFSSKNGVRHFLEALQNTGRDLRSLGGARLAVVGDATAKELQKYHLRADVIPIQQNALGLAELLSGVTKNCLLVRTDRGKLDLFESLNLSGANVEVVDVYRQVNLVTPTDTFLKLLKEGEPIPVLVTSGNQLRPLREKIPGDLWPRAMEQIRLISISEAVSAQAVALGFKVAESAATPAVDDLLAALLRYFGVSTN